MRHYPDGGITTIEFGYDGNLIAVATIVFAAIVVTGTVPFKRSVSIPAVSRPIQALGSSRVMVSRWAAL
ncbi:MAG: hypothetical protein CMJ46_03035 [Planctomyces sp.]|nr:hypothetical protein [Planctomyces sp.]